MCTALGYKRGSPRTIQVVASDQERRRSFRDSASIDGMDEEKKDAKKLAASMTTENVRIILGGLDREAQTM